MSNTDKYAKYKSSGTGSVIVSLHIGLKNLLKMMKEILFIITCKKIAREVSDLFSQEQIYGNTCMMYFFHRLSDVTNNMGRQGILNYGALDLICFGRVTDFGRRSMRSFDREIYQK